MITQAGKIILMKYISIMLIAHVGRSNDLLIKSNSKEYVIEVNTKIAHWGRGKSNTDLFLAYLSSNEYQQAEMLSIDSIGTITDLGKSGDKCIYYNVPLGLWGPFGKNAEFYNSFLVRTHDVQVDFTKLNNLAPYDPSSHIYHQLLLH